MPHDITPVLADKMSIAQELFVRTADENYITARWCGFHWLSQDFLWLAVHALEKYMKASLLLNGRPAKNYGHDIGRLYEDLKEYAADLLPTTLEQPETLQIDYWFKEAPGDFCERLMEFGNADARYGIFGHQRRSEDLHKLDKMMFWCRRLCRPLEAYCAGRFGEDRPTMTNRELLTRQPRWWKVDPTLIPEQAAGEWKYQKEVRDALFRLNVEFAPEGYQHKPSGAGCSSRPSVLLSRIPAIDPDQEIRDDQRDRHIEVCEWVIDNIKLPSSRNNNVLKEFKEALERLKALDPQSSR